MQRENERIIYHLMHFNEKDKEWSERPYLLLEDMAIVFDILDLDDQSIQRIDHKKANKEQWSDQFLWESAKKNTKQLLPAKFEPVYKDFRGHTEDRPVFVVSNKIQRYGAGVICYEDFLGDISRKYNKSLYLLPTSIHEMLLLFDDGEDQGEKHGIPHLRRGDVAELLKRRSAVEIGGFVLLRGDGDEPCEQQNNAVPRVFPEVHEDHDPEGVFAVQPLDDGQV